MIVRNGETYPWMNESIFDDVLCHWDMKDFEVFEYGSGASTLWWSHRCRSVISTESEKEWYDKLLGETGKYPNIEMRFRELVKCVDCPYVQSINESPKMYDLIVIDGRNRVLCCAEAVKHLKPSGRVIFDDTQRRGDYQPGIDLIDGYFKDQPHIKYVAAIDRSHPEKNKETTIWMPK